MRFSMDIKDKLRVDLMRFSIDIKDNSGDLMRFSIDIKEDKDNMHWFDKMTLNPPPPPPPPTPSLMGRLSPRHTLALKAFTFGDIKNVLQLYESMNFGELL